jgi:hypothetical protein
MDAGASSTETLLIALAGGAIGALLAGVAWVALRLAGIPGDLAIHDFEVRVLNEDLELWVADTYRALERELAGIKNSAGNQLYSGSHLNARTAAKTQALHRWRDRLHEAERDLVAVQVKENWAHRLWRRRRSKYRNELGLTAEGRVEPVIQEFRRAVEIPGGATAEVRDPTTFTLDDLLVEIAKLPLT